MYDLLLSTFVQTIIKKLIKGNYEK
jgi:hypothetical protein